MGWAKSPILVILIRDTSLLGKEKEYEYGRFYD